jgi:hypothetical protein
MRDFAVSGVGLLQAIICFSPQTFCPHNSLKTRGRSWNATGFMSLSWRCLMPPPPLLLVLMLIMIMIVIAIRSSLSTNGKTPFCSCGRHGPSRSKCQPRPCALPNCSKKLEKVQGHCAENACRNSSAHPAEMHRTSGKVLDVAQQSQDGSIDECEY